MQSPGAPTPAWLVLALALALTAIDAAKPLVIDDGAYEQYARHIASDPLDPYGFEVFWYDAPVPGNQVLAPPVVPYWLALGMTLFGDRPLAWKLWMFPPALLLVVSLAGLVRRLVPGDGRPWLALLVLSPAVLPALNLMLDLPAFALVLAALLGTLRACDRKDSLGPAVAAGLLAGLALQTKYNAVLPLLAALVYAGMAGRRDVAGVVGGAAAFVFLGWELAMWARYGEPTFALGARLAQSFSDASPLQWAAAFACLLACSTPMMGPAALLGGGAGARWCVAGVGVAVAGLAAVGALPGAAVAHVGSLHPSDGPLAPEAWILAPLGILAIVAAGVVGARAVRDARSDPAARFLLVWLAIECAGFFVVSPYPALRRMIGIHLALTLLTARTLARREPSPVGVVALLVGALAVGGLFATSEVMDARARGPAIERAAAWIDATPAGRSGRRWYAGHWGVRYYADSAGLTPVVPGRSVLEPGDWLILPRGVHRQALRIPEGKALRVETIVSRSPWPWSTIPGAYGGYRALRPQPAAQMEIVILRVVARFTP